MALVTSSNLPSPLSPTVSLQAALQLFEEALTQEQRQHLHQHAATPNSSSVIVFVAEIDASNQSSRRSAASRLTTFLDAAQQFVGVVDTFVSSNPAIAALVWGGIKTCILVANARLPYFEKVTAMIAEIGRSTPTYTQFGSVYRDDLQVQAALCGYYTIIVRICTKIIQVQQQSTRVLSFLGSSFELDFDPLLRELEKQEKQVRLQLHLTSQIIMIEEGKANKRSRRLASIFQSASLREQGMAKKSRANSCRQQILDNLSEVKFRQIWARIHGQRVVGTAEWFTREPDFQTWHKSAGTSVLCCSGMLGVGKSVLISSIVAFLEQNRSSERHIAYHFCQTGYEITLEARNVVGSIARQLLTGLISHVQGNDLDEMLSKSSDIGVDGIVSMVELLLETGVGHTCFIILDGLDECSETDLKTILSMLLRLYANPSLHIKILYSCRPELESTLSKHLRCDARIVLNKDKLEGDIKQYIDTTLQQCIDEQKLQLSDAKLLLKIATTMENQCDGMLLWLSLFVSDLCAQNNDAAIVECLRHPPRGIKELYNKRLLRIRSHRLSGDSIKLLRYVGVARRPLTMGEAREALSIQFGQKELDFSMLSNDMNQILKACYGLIHIDEGTGTLQYVHSSLYSYLFDDPLGKMHDFDHLNVEIQFGTICMTYLSFKNLTQRVVKTPGVTHLQFKPIDLAMLPVLSSTTLDSKLAQNLLRLRRSFSHAKSQELHNILQGLSLPQAVEFEFLNYASSYWLHHTRELTSANCLDFWQLFAKCVVNKDLDPWKPWLITAQAADEEAFPSDTVTKWATANDHDSLISYYILTEARETDNDSRELILRYAAKCSHGFWHDLSSDPSDKSVFDRCMFLLPLARDCAALLTIIKAISRTATSFSTRSLDRHLAIAVLQGEQRAVDVSLALGADANFARWPEERPPLHQSLYDGQEEIANALLSAGAEVNAIDSDGYSPLHYAVSCGFEKIASKLLSTGARMFANGTGWHPLHLAVSKANKEMIEMLLMNGADPNSEGLLGQTPLYLSLEGVSFREIANALLAAGAHINITDSTGWTPLHHAVAMGRLEVVEFLLSAGARVDDTDRRKESPLYHAVIARNKEMVDLLVASGIDVDIRGFNRRTPLHAAVRYGFEDMVDILMICGANIYAVDGIGLSPFFRALESENRGILDLFLVAGANMNVPDQSGKLPLHFAVSRGSRGMVEALLAAGADANATDTKGRSPLFIAVAMGRQTLLQVLLRAGADMALEDKNGDTPLSLAQKKGDYKVIELLLKYG